MLILFITLACIGIAIVLGYLGYLEYKKIKRRKRRKNRPQEEAIRYIEK